MLIRPAAEFDLDGIASVRLAIGDAHDDSGADPRYCRFLIDHGKLLVAVGAASDGAGDGRVVGFVGTVEVGPARLLSDLFIDPRTQGGGVGRALLGEALQGSSRRFTFSSSDARALPIYARNGMLARWPLLYLRGSVDGLPLVGDLIVGAGPVEDAAAFEESIVGHDRVAIYRYWASRPGSTTVIVRRLGAIVATGVVYGAATVGAESIERQPAGSPVRIEHLVVGDAEPAEVFAAVARFATSGEVLAYVPGERQLSAWLLSRRFVLDDIDTFMATEPDVVVGSLAVVHPGLC